MKVYFFRFNLIFFLILLFSIPSKAQKHEIAVKAGGHLAQSSGFLNTFGEGPFAIEFEEGRDLAVDVGLMYRFNGGLRWSLELEGLYSNFKMFYNVRKASINMDASLFEPGGNSAQTLHIPLRLKYFVKPGLSLFGGIGAQIFIAEEMDDLQIPNEPELSELFNSANALNDGTVPFIELGAGLEVTDRISVDIKYIFALGSVINNFQFQNTSIAPDVNLRAAFVNLSYRFLKF